MKFTYYEFPSELPNEERASAIHNIVGGDVSQELVKAKEYPQKIECKKATAKKLLKLYGGKAYTEHLDRSTRVVTQVIPITLVSENKLKELRKKAGLSQKELADKICVNQATICLWETYQALPKRGSVKKLASILNCPEDDFMQDIYEHIHRYAS